MVKANCVKCGATVSRITPRYDVTLEPEDINNTIARVQFRSGMYILINGEQHFFDTSEVVDIPYSWIIAVLAADKNAVSFIQATQKHHFLLVYPTYKGFNL